MGGSKPCLSGTNCRHPGCCFAHPGQKPGDPPPGGWGAGSPVFNPAFQHANGASTGVTSGAQGRLYSGIIKAISNGAGLVSSGGNAEAYGLISSSEVAASYGCDVLVEKENIQGLQVGQEVAFIIVLNDKYKPTARQIKVKEA